MSYDAEGLEVCIVCVCVCEHVYVCVSMCTCVCKHVYVCVHIVSWRKQSQQEGESHVREGFLWIRQRTKGSVAMLQHLGRVTVELGLFTRM